MADNHGDPLLKLITRRSLFDTYRRLLDLLDELGIPATFALVGAFVGSRDEFEARRKVLDESPEHRTWMTHVDHSMREDSDGWFLPELRELLLERPQHEIATHGYSHIPFDAEGVTSEGRQLELREGVSSLGVTVKSIVFPRNAVVDIGLLRAFGITIYRDAATTVQQGLRGRIGRTLDELVGVPRSLQHPLLEDPTPIPAGRLLHWRHGVRRIVSLRRTEMLWNRIADDAIDSGQVAHLWLHPHNLITGYRQFDLLANVLRSLAARRSDGLACLTFADYVATLH